jgi:hypothetical protein
MVHDLPDPLRFSKIVSDLIVTASRALERNGQHIRRGYSVRVCDENVSA